jgi:very-short-patch-repair endonuclease
MLEIRLWRELRDRRLDGWKFRRQVPIEGFIVDFVCFEARLIIEMDGPVHLEPEQQTRMCFATAFFARRDLGSCGFLTKPRLGQVVESFKLALANPPPPALR